MVGARHIGMVLFASVAAACATVRQEDTEAWVGKPVAALEKHPVFLTMPVVRTRASDGTEIWNYVNGRNVGTCSGSGGIYTGLVDYASYTAFTACMSRVAACNNIFYIKNGIVERYTPIGSGGLRCYTDARLQPGFSGPTNIQ
jgi:hypothetical protein